MKKKNSARENTFFFVYEQSKKKKKSFATTRAESNRKPVGHPTPASLIATYLTVHNNVIKHNKML